METRVLRRQTKVFIESDATVLRLVPHTEERTPAGGLRRAPRTARKPQSFRVVAKDRRATANGGNLVVGRSQDGDIRADNLELLGEWDAEMERGDQFDLDGTTYVVTEVQPAGSAPYLRRAFATGLPEV